MHNVNWWLMALAFLLGLLLTLAMMIRRVTREVPVVHTVSAGVKASGAVAAAGAAAAKLHDKVGERAEHVHKVVAATAEKVEKHHAEVVEKVEKHHAEVVEKVEKHHAEVVEKVEQHHHEVVKKVESRLGPAVVEAAPYGAGSIRVSARTIGPAGYPIKGDKDTGRYFTEDSPDFETIEAEVWFATEESAQKAGFLRWDAKGDGVAAGLTSAAATVVREDHSADSTMVIQSGETVAPGVEIRTVSVTETGEAPYGRGSARAGADGSGPAGWLIKGNADSMLFHGPDSPAYEQTIAEVWFLDEATARAAGFDKWDKNFK
ncbi:MAG: hypothetical protein KIH64_004295 [Mycobacterium sp.]|nr:hypothetical protein [Mycobacterium sp.]